MKNFVWIPVLALMTACGSAPEPSSTSEDSADELVTAFDRTGDVVHKPGGVFTREFLVSARPDGKAANRCLPIIKVVSKGGGVVPKGGSGGIFTSTRLFEAVTPADGPVFCRYTWVGGLPIPQAGLDALDANAEYYRNEGDARGHGGRTVFQQLTGKMEGDGSPTHVEVSTTDVPSKRGKALKAKVVWKGGSMGCSSCVQVYDSAIRVILPEYAVGHDVYVLPHGNAETQRLVLTEGHQAFWLTVPQGWSASSVVVDW